MVYDSLPSFKYESGKEDSILTKHQMAKVTGIYKDCLTRQITEGVDIRRCTAILMNTKAEWHQPPIWRVQS